MSSGVHISGLIPGTVICEYMILGETLNIFNLFPNLKNGIYNSTFLTEWLYR